MVFTLDPASPRARCICGQTIVRLPGTDAGWMHDGQHDQIDWALTERVGCYKRARPCREDAKAMRRSATVAHG